jgi:hypothetical protein
MKTFPITYQQPDFLAVGCFGWGRAKTAREAFRLARANASPDLCKPESRLFKIWRLADQLDEVSVDPMGGWSAQYAQPMDGEPSEPAKRLVAIVKANAKPKAVAELPTEVIAEE